MIIVKAEGFPWDESEEMVDYAVEQMQKMSKQHRADWIEIGNLIVATSEAQLEEALRRLPKMYASYAWLYKAVLL